MGATPSLSASISDGENGRALFSSFFFHRAVLTTRLVALPGDPPASLMSKPAARWQEEEEEEETEVGQTHRDLRSDAFLAACCSKMTRGRIV